MELADERIESADMVLASGGIQDILFAQVGREFLPEEFVRLMESYCMMESVLMVQQGINFYPSPYTTIALYYCYKNEDLEGSVKRPRTGDLHKGTK